MNMLKMKGMESNSSKALLSAGHIWRERDPTVAVFVEKYRCGNWVAKGVNSHCLLCAGWFVILNQVRDQMVPF